MQMKRNGLYRTSDLYLAVWLLTNRFELEDIDRSNSRRCNFIFVDRQDRLELVHQFLCGRAVGNLSDFVFNLRRAKRLLYSSEV